MTTMLECKCGNTVKHEDVMPPDTCECGRGWGGAKDVKNPQAGSEAGSECMNLLSCKRWHENEIAALKRYMVDGDSDGSPLAESMKKNLRCKITQHETFVKALTAVTT
jgi:hypothetical protein